MGKLFDVLQLLLFLVALSSLHERSAAKASATPDDGRLYIFVGVSGGLQDGFPDHNKMDLRDEDTVVEAIYVGRALVRGTKSFLDVMEPGWRQFIPRNSSGAQPLINSVVMVSGCHEHANQYWIYAVDSRQFVTILNNEPRFLSITPDTGLVDLLSDQTDETVKLLAQHEIERQNKTDTSRVSFPIVVVVWYHESFVPSPVIQRLEDGTSVTNFPESLAKWASVDDADRTAGWCSTVAEDESCPAKDEAMAANKRYWDGIRRAIRHAEDNRLPKSEWQSHGPPFQCEQLTRLGVDPETARINYPFSPSELESIFRTENGFEVDFHRAEIKKI